MELPIGFAFTRNQPLCAVLLLLLLLLLLFVVVVVVVVIVVVVLVVVIVVVVVVGVQLKSHNHPSFIPLYPRIFLSQKRALSCPETVNAEEREEIMCRLKLF